MSIVRISKGAIYLTIAITMRSDRLADEREPWSSLRKRSLGANHPINRQMPRDTTGSR